MHVNPVRVESEEKVINSHHCERLKLQFRDHSRFSLQRAQHVIAIEAGFRDWTSLVNASEIEQRFALVMVQEPFLNHNGLRLRDTDRRIPSEERKRTLAEQRSNLRSCVDEVGWTVKWLETNIARIKTINWVSSSYNLKHIAEKNHPSGYLSNGVMIAAAIASGYSYKRYEDSLSAFFNMSQRSINALRSE